MIYRSYTLHLGQKQNNRRRFLNFKLLDRFLQLTAWHKLVTLAHKWLVMKSPAMTLFVWQCTSCNRFLFLFKMRNYVHKGTWKFYYTGIVCKVQSQYNVMDECCHIVLWIPKKIHFITAAFNIRLDDRRKITHFVECLFFWNNNIVSFSFMCVLFFVCFFCLFFCFCFFGWLVGWLVGFFVCFVGIFCFCLFVCFASHFYWLFANLTSSAKQQYHVVSIYFDLIQIILPSECSRDFQKYKKFSLTLQLQFFW